MFNPETKKYDTLKIVEEQAKVIRTIFERYYAGESLTTICAYLNANQIPSPSKKNTNWYPSTLQTILRNEKYKGDVLTQKTYCADLLTHKRVKNNGEVVQHYLQDHHEAIQFTHKKMETNVDCVYCFDEVTPEDGGVLEYYKQMTDRVEHGKTFDHETEMEKAFWERYQKSYDDWSRKQTENMSPPVSRYNDDEDDEIPKHMNDDEPLVERDFEG